MARTLIFTATYNESDNIVTLIKEIRLYAPSADILIVDDSSPDGTGQIVEELTKTISGLSIIHRPRKAGLGSAHMLAVKRALRDKYDFLITLDADFSHHPKYLPELMTRLDAGYDFVIGSRYTEGGKCDYGFLRQWLSRSANFLAINLLGVPLKETTTSYRGFSAHILNELDLNCIRSTGYSFFVEFLYHISRKTDKLVEFPIHFEDRRAGTTKISKIEIFKGVVTLFRLAAHRVVSKFRPNKRPKQHSVDPVATMPCPICNFTDHTIIFHSNTADVKEGARYKCTNTHHNSHGQIVRCLGCGLIFTNPQMPAKDIQALYAEVEDCIYLDNISAREKTFRYNLDHLKGYLPNSGKLLDVGAYCGIFMETAAQDGYEVSGVEPSLWANEYCRNRGLKVSPGTLQTLPESQRNFDIITSWDVLEHVSDPMAELAEINRRLRLGGVLAFSTLHVENWFPKIAGERWPWYMDMHLYYFTKNILKFMLEQNGFEVIHTRPYCHIITGEYLVRKCDSLGLPFLKFVVRGPLRKLLKKVYVPFRFGDIQLIVARKVADPAVRKERRPETPPKIRLVAAG